MSTDDMRLTLGDEVFDGTIQHVWHGDRWYFSILDVIAAITQSNQPSRYWTELRAKLAAEGAAELFDKIEKLKMTAKDGKQRLTESVFWQ